MKIILVCLVLLFVASPVYAEWDNADTGLLILRIIDWGQTREIAANPFTGEYEHYKIGRMETGSPIGYTEMNPILGTNPTIEEVNTYFIILIGCDYLIAKYANPKYKKYWQVIQISLETYCVTKNIGAGVKFRF
jgi:hypothetical protein